MRRFILYIALFTLQLLLILIFIPIDKRLRYIGLKNDCFNHGVWVYDRIHNNSTLINIAFLGSSHTINAIDDKYLTNVIDSINFVNFGYCRLGRNLQYVLLKEILQKKNLKKIVIEFRENENRYSHPVFPLIADSKDVLLANPFFNRDIIKDMFTHFTYKLQALPDMLFNKSYAVKYQQADFGFAPHLDTASYPRLNEIKISKSKKQKELSPLEKSFHGKYSKVYLNKIARLCSKNNIELCFLYLPSYGAKRIENKNIEMYQQMGKILIPSANLFSNINNWHDENHLNITGATELTKWLAKEIDK